MYLLASPKSFSLRLRWQVIFCSFLPVFLGFFIYLVFRSEHILVNRWFMYCVEVCHLSDYMRYLKLSLGTYKLPSWVLYNLPDALWLFACAYCMLLLWRRQSNILFVLMPLLMALLHEFAQLHGYVRGTFDWRDVSFYLISYLVTLIVYRLLNRPHSSYL